ncbi:PAS domain S-box protein, partial [archaeon]|nr:PAS domain S-box protein [archaeon]
IIGEDPEKGFNGRSVFDFLDPSDHQAAVQNLNLIRNGRSELKNVYSIHSQKGQEYWVEVSGKRILFHGIDADLVTITDITGRVRAEEELQRKQARLDSLFSAVPTGIGIIADDIMVEINDRICEISGYSREEILGKSSAVFYPSQEVFEFVQTEKQRLLMTNPICSLETKWKRKNGAIIDVFLRYSQLIPGDPEAGVTFTALDISKRKELDRVLKDSEERYRRITSAITSYIYTVTLENGRPSGTVHSVACEAVTGYSPAEFESDPYLWYTMIYEPDREKVLSHIEKVLSDQHVEPIEHCIIHRDGSIRWISNTPVIHRNDAGAITSYDGVISDITKRKLAEEALRESEIRFRTLHEASFGGIGIHDKGVILDCNQGLSNISGYTIDELIGMNGLNLIAPEWRDHVMQKIVSGYEKPYDVEGLRKDGTIYSLEIRGKNMPYRGHTVRVTEFRDITDRKMAEDALRDSEERLRNIIENSTNAFYSHTINNNLTYISPRIK